MVIQTGDNKFGVAKWIVDPTAGLGTHQTITAAISSASSGDTIFVRPGTYTENLSITTKNLNIVSFTGDSDLSITVILGKISISGAISVSFSNIELRTNGDYFLEVTGNSATEVNINNCYLNCSNSTGLNYTTTNASATIIFDRCEGAIGAAGNSYFAMSSTGILAYYYCTVGNPGGSTTASTISAGVLALRYCYFANPITTSGTAVIGFTHVVMNNGQNNTVLTHGGGASTVQNSVFVSGTSTAISVGGTLTITNSNIDSSNTNAIAGAGTIIYGGLTFSSTSSHISTTTKTLVNEGPSRTIGSTNSGGTNTLTITNLSNTASSQSLLQTTVAGGTAGDPYHVFTVTGGNSAALGVDNSDSDKFKVSYSTALGTTDTIIADATGGQYKGYGTNTAPAAGFIGEQIRATVALGSAVALTTATPTNVTSISLTAGIWDVSAVASFSGNPTTNTAFAVSISTVSATGGTAGDNAVNTPTPPNASANNSLTIPSYRISLAATTTVYLVVNAVFGAGSCSAYGRISATRVA